MATFRQRLNQVLKFVTIAFLYVMLIRFSKRFATLSSSSSSHRVHIDYNSMLPDLLVFGRVPKSGSEMFVRLLQALGRKNHFTHTRFGAAQPRKLARAAQAQFVSKVLHLARPASYDRHIYYVDFLNHTSSSPIWFSMVRDPVDKFVSRFHYMRYQKIKEDRDSNGNSISETNISRAAYLAKNIESCIVERDPECTFFLGKRYDLTIPYFCGHEDECQVLGSTWALERAKQNLERSFPVVGVLENLNHTLLVLQQRLPRFFKGVVHLYNEDLREPHTNSNSKKKLKPSGVAKTILSTNLSMEYDFYNYVHKRLQEQTKVLNIRYP